MEMSSMRLFRNRMRADCWQARLDGPQMSSMPRTTATTLTCRTRLLVTVTSFTTDHSCCWLVMRAVRSMATPLCACSQQYSKILPSIKTRCAFFNSNRFLTSQTFPRRGGEADPPDAPVSVNEGFPVTVYEVQFLELADGGSLVR